MSALDIQIGGEHYKSAKIQPVQYIEANGLGFLEGCVVKRVTRHNKPTGKGRQDIEKAIYELQLLLELRYAPVEAPMTFSERCAEIDAEVHAVRRSKTNLPLHPDLVAPVVATECGECGYPDDGAGTHYATCSKLTAPKEFVAEVEATFDELEGARPTVVVEEPPMPEPMRSRFIDALESLDEADYPPAEDPWVGAPEWAKYKAQDSDGDWYWYDLKPEKHYDDQWSRLAKVKGQCMFADSGNPNPHWRDTLIERTSG